MATDDSDPDPDDEPRQVVAQATADFLNAVSPGAGDEFLDELAERGIENIDEAILGGAMVGEKINAMRQQSRGMTARATEQQPADLLVHSRTVEDERGEYIGTRIWVDDPNAELFQGDRELLFRAGRSEVTVQIPQGVGEIEQEENDSVWELLVRPPGWEPDPTADLKPMDEADDYTECIECYKIAQSQRTRLDRCPVHDPVPEEGAGDNRLSDPATGDKKPPADDAVDSTDDDTEPGEDDDA